MTPRFFPLDRPTFNGIYSGEELNNLTIGYKTNFIKSIKYRVQSGSGILQISLLNANGNTLQLPKTANEFHDLSGDYKLIKFEAENNDAKFSISINLE